MKRILASSVVALVLTLGALTGVASASPAASTSAQARYSARYAPAPQRWSRPARTRFVTRTVRQGWHLYRVTYRITTFRNGRTTSSVVRTIRIR